MLKQNISKQELLTVILTKCSLSIVLNFTGSRANNFRNCWLQLSLKIYHNHTKVFTEHRIVDSRPVSSQQFVANYGKSFFLLVLL